MTKKAFIEALKEYPDDLEVRFGYFASDYWKTHLAVAPTKADIANIIYSEYHQKDKIVDGEEDSKFVILIS